MKLLIKQRVFSWTDTYDVYDEYGNVYIAVDMELKGRIREAIMKMILEFDIKIE